MTIQDTDVFPVTRPGVGTFKVPASELATYSFEDAPNGLVDGTVQYARQVVTAGATNTKTWAEVDIPPGTIVAATAPPAPVDGQLWFSTASEVLSVWDGAAWQPAMADATETAAGVIEIATQAEVDAGVDGTRSVTPATLAASPLSSKWTRTGTDLEPATAGDVVPSKHISFLQAGTGAVQRTVESKLQDVVSVKDFGAVGDGVTDDTAAIQAAIDYAETFIVPDTASQALRNDSNRGVVWFPPGAYRVTATLVINGPGVHVKGSGVAATIIESWFDGNLFDARSDLETTTGSLHNIAFSDFSARGRFVDPTQGAAIRVGIVKHVYIYSIHFNGFYDDVALQGTQEPVWISNCNFFANNNVTANRTGNAHIRAAALEVDAGSANAQVGPDASGKYYAYCSSIMVSDCEMRTASGFKEFGVLIGACDGFYLQNCHLLNHQEQVRVSRGNSLCPCANIRIQNCFFDGESPSTLRNVFIVSTEAQVGGLSVCDVYISGCKFNGVGDNSIGVEAWLLVEDVAIKKLTVTNSFFDKARSETAAAVDIRKGEGTCTLSGNTFLCENLNVPTAIIRSNAVMAAAADIFEHLIIDSNRFICSGTADRPDYNIRLANAQNKTIISNNIYYGHSGAGDALLYDTKTSGTTFGSATTNNNINIS